MKNKLYLDSIKEIEKNTDPQTIKIYQEKILKNNKMKKKEGDYYAIQFSLDTLLKNPQKIQKEVVKIIRKFLEKYHGSTILILGMGKNELLIDSLGHRITEEFLHQKKNRVLILNPEEMEERGMLSANFLSDVLKNHHPNLIMQIDTLVTNHRNYLNRVIEITDTIPYSNHFLSQDKEITENINNIPILSMGIPLFYQEGKTLLESIYLKKEMPLLAYLLFACINHSITR